MKTNESTAESYYYKTGKYFGYPDCCINEFIAFNKRTPAQESRAVHKGYGFIPCAKHSQQIIEGKITLESLIKFRQCKTPFPHES